MSGYQGFLKEEAEKPGVDRRDRLQEEVHHHRRNKGFYRRCAEDQREDQEQHGLQESDQKFDHRDCVVLPKEDPEVKIIAERGKKGGAAA